ncbi:hypothetical protein TBR22_A47140 [Luteitalea sp. TBR-22]|nr:hypothetical protein TBR22_A47140 [Luteitalea sp. TBR-22]
MKQHFSLGNCFCVPDLRYPPAQTVRHAAIVTANLENAERVDPALINSHKAAGRMPFQLVGPNDC